MTIFERIWTDENIERLKGMVEKRMSYRAIGAVLKCTKNSVAGAINRYVNNSKIKNPRISLKPPSIKHNVPRGKLSINFPKKYGRMPSEREIKHAAVPFPSEGCLSLVGDSRALMCCGLPRISSYSWCKAHCDIYFIPRKPQ